MKPKPEGVNLQVHVTVALVNGADLRMHISDADSATALRSHHGSMCRCKGTARLEMGWIVCVCVCVCVCVRRLRCVCSKVSADLSMCAAHRKRCQLQQVGMQASRADAIAGGGRVQHANLGGRPGEWS